VGISSFDAVALNIKEKSKLIVVIDDARKQMIYSCSYIYKDLGKLDRVSEYNLQSLRDFYKDIQRLSKKYKRDIIFTNSGIKSFRDELQKVFGKAVFADENKWLPKAANIASLAFELCKLQKRKKNKDIESEPLYLHSQYANISKPKKI
jgi:tRNA A37 threonylcarbamoyladenosine modification protein TsaB